MQYEAGYVEKSVFSCDILFGMARSIHHIRGNPTGIRSLPSSVKLICAFIFVYSITWGMANPFIPLFLYDVLGSYTAVTIISASLFVFGAVWIFPMGELLDRFSAKKVIGLMVLLYLPLWPYLAFLQTFTQAIFYQIYHSFIGTTLWGSVDTYTRKNSPAHQRGFSMGVSDMSHAVGLIVGALLGGTLLLYVFDFRELFLIAPPLFVILSFCIILFIPPSESLRNSKLMDGLRSIEWKVLYRKEICDFWERPHLRRLWVFIFILGFLTISQITLLPLFANAIGANVLQVGLIYAAFMLPIVFEARSSVWADTLSAKYLVMTGSLIAALSLFSLALVEAPLFVFPLAFTIGIAIAMMQPAVSGVATADMPCKQTGELNAVYMASNGLGGVVGLVVMGPFADILGIHTVFFFASGMMFASAFLVKLLWKPTMTT